MAYLFKYFIFSILAVYGIGSAHKTEAIDSVDLITIGFINNTILFSDLVSSRCNLNFFSILLHKSKIELLDLNPYRNSILTTFRSSLCNIIFTHSCSWLAILILLSGDIEPNPWPPAAP